MALSVTYTESPNTVIRSARWNRNFDDVEDWANAHEINGTAVHGVTGTIVGTTDAQTLSSKIFDLTDVKIYGGYDLKLYSDSGTTLKASIDGSTGNTSLEGTLGVTGASTFGAGVTLNSNDPTLILKGNLASGVHYNYLKFQNNAGTDVFQMYGSYYGGASTTYLLPASGQSLSLGANGVADYLTISTSGNTAIAGTLSVPTATKLFLDGGSNTSIRESAADVITFEAGGSDVVGMSTTSMSLSSALQFNIQTTKKLFFDGGSNTSIRESAADVLTFETGGSDRLSIGSNGDCNFDSGTFYVDAANNRTYWGGTSINTSGSYDTAVRQVVSSGTQFDSRICTSAGATGIQEETYHNSASPSNSDGIYTAIYAGNDNGGSYNIYAQKGVTIEDTTAGSEDATMIFSTMKAGTLTHRIELNSTNITVYDDLYFSSNNTYDIGQATPIAPRDIYSTNAVTVTSDERQKESIQDSDLGLDFILSLKPKKYKWKNSIKDVVSYNTVKDRNGNDKKTKKVDKVKKEDSEKRYHYGLVAQQIKEVLGDHDFGGFCYNKESDFYMLRYDEFIAPIIKAIQELNKKLEG